MTFELAKQTGKKIWALCNSQSYPLSDRRVYHRIRCLYVCTEFVESSDTGTGVHSARTDLEDHFMGIDPAKRKYFYDCDHDAVLLFTRYGIGADVGLSLIHI